MSEYTAQEWQRDGTTVYALNIEGTNRFSAQVQGGWATDGRLRTDAAELEANARLMEAAKDLLEALDEMVHWHAHRGGDNPFSDMPLPEDQQPSEIRKAMAAIRKAIGANP